MEILWSHEREIALKWLKFTYKAICFLAGIGSLKASIDPNQAELIAVGSFIGLLKLPNCLVCNIADKITTYTLCRQRCTFSSWFFHPFLLLQSVQEAVFSINYSQAVSAALLSSHTHWNHCSLVSTSDLHWSPNLLVGSSELPQEDLLVQSFRPTEAGGSEAACVLPVPPHMKSWHFDAHPLFLNASVSQEFLKEN